MNTRVLAGVALAGFTALNLYALSNEGLSGLRDAVLNARGWSLVLVVDLAISLLLIAAWIWRDARKRALPPLPFVVTTLAMGSIGTLSYLVFRRPEERKP